MLNHKGTQILHTPRLLLRPFTPDDAQAMFDNWASDENVTRYLTWQPHTSPELTRQLLTEWSKEYAKPDYYNWVMELEGVPIGNISVVYLDDHHEYAVLGYCMGKAYWNQGLMTEAASTVIDFLFAQIGVHRIEISHAIKNPGSGRVAQKCGLTREGIKRSFYKTIQGEYLDIAYYSILRNEWEHNHC